MTEVEFQAGDELDGDLQNEGDAGTADENADATAVSVWAESIHGLLNFWSIRCVSGLIFRLQHYKGGNAHPGQYARNIGRLWNVIASIMRDTVSFSAYHELRAQICCSRSPVSARAAQWGRVPSEGGKEAEKECESPNDC